MTDHPSGIAGLAAHPWVPLGHLPTPIDETPNLSAALGVTVLVKRDDCTGLALGGNKVRQLEYYLGDARAREADTILITGAVQSNFVRLAAAGARKLGMEAHVQLEERVPSNDQAYRESGNVLLDRLLGAHVHSFAVGEDEAAADRSLEGLAARLVDQGRRPYVIHLGVEHPPIGALGYVRAASEIVAQLTAADTEVDAVVVASGSGLTHAGLLVGLRAVGSAVPVHGICVRRDAESQTARILARAREVAALIDRPDLVEPADVLLSDEALAPGYGRASAATLEAITMAARLEGLLVDPVYTGKVMAGLIGMARSGELSRAGPPGRRARVLFVHTGGQPALFAYRTLLEPALAPGDAPRGGTDCLGDARRMTSG